MYASCGIYRVGFKNQSAKPRGPLAGVEKGKINGFDAARFQHPAKDGFLHLVLSRPAGETTEGVYSMSAALCEEYQQVAPQNATT
jgi:hypothetical protein